MANNVANLSGTQDILHANQRFDAHLAPYVGKILRTFTSDLATEFDHTSASNCRPIGPLPLGSADLILVTVKHTDSGHVCSPFSLVILHHR